LTLVDDLIGGLWIIAWELFSHFVLHSPHREKIDCNSLFFQ